MRRVHRDAPQFQRTEELRTPEIIVHVSRLDWVSHARHGTHEERARARAIIILCIIYVIPRVYRVQCGSTNQNALLMQIAVVARRLGVNSQSATGE